jgi:hypothetical protein
MSRLIQIIDCPAGEWTQLYVNGLLQYSGLKIPEAEYRKLLTFEGTTVVESYRYRDLRYIEQYEDSALFKDINQEWIRQV